MARKAPKINVLELNWGRLDRFIEDRGFGFFSKELFNDSFDKRSTFFHISAIRAFDRNHGTNIEDDVNRESSVGMWYVNFDKHTFFYSDEEVEPYLDEIRKLRCDGLREKIEAGYGRCIHPHLLEKLFSADEIKRLNTLVPSDTTVGRERCLGVLNIRDGRKVLDIIARKSRFSTWGLGDLLSKKEEIILDDAVAIDGCPACPVNVMVAAYDRNDIFGNEAGFVYTMAPDGIVGKLADEAAALLSRQATKWSGYPREYLDKLVSFVELARGEEFAKDCLGKIRQKLSEEEEYERLLAKFRAKNFSTPNEMSNYIRKKGIGHKYPHIAGHLEMFDPDQSDRTFDFEGGLRPDIYRRLCEDIGFQKVNSRYRPGNFRSFEESGEASKRRSPKIVFGRLV